MNDTHPRFKLGTEADRDAIQQGKIGKQARTEQGQDYSIPVNKIIESWNKASTFEALANNWIVADIYNATSESEIDDYGAIHLRDKGRRIELQVILNSVRGHVNKMNKNK